MVYRMLKPPAKIFGILLQSLYLLEKNHLSRVGHASLRPQHQSAFFLICAATLITIAIAANVYVRHAQLQIWHSEAPSTLILDAPTFSTADAPLFLRRAADMQRGNSVHYFNASRSYPNNLMTGPEPADHSGIRDNPLLSVVLAKLASSNDKSSLLEVGNMVLVATSALTAAAIAICFGAAGYWTQGAIASLGGGLSAAYLVRSSIGRIDTDQLNLGLMYLIFGLVVFAGRAPSRLWCFGWCLAAGLLANLFIWWYGKPELIVIAAIPLFWLLCCLQRNILTVLVGTTVFLALSGIEFFNPLNSSYLKDVFAEASFIFPNTFSTITEIQTASFAQILVNTTGSVEMGLVCLTGLALFLFRHPVIAIGYGPLVALGLMNFVIGNRAIFYSAPIMGLAPPS